MKEINKDMPPKQKVRHRRYFSLAGDIGRKDLMKNNKVEGSSDSIVVNSNTIDEKILHTLDRNIFNECGFIKRFGSLSVKEKELMKILRGSKLIDGQNN